MKSIAWMFGAIALLATTATADPVAPVFTYQGQLTQNGSPVNGSVAMIFSLWDAESGGNQMPGFGNQTALVQVTNGAFTVTLNAYSSFDTGQARWLQIAVCADPASCGSATVLAPRQALTATPYAHYALKPWIRSGNDFYVPGGTKIGINGVPTQPLEVYGDGGASLRVDGNSDLRVNGGSDSIFGFFNEGAAAGGTAFIGQGLFRLYVQNNGHVGINTSSPASELDVRGSVRLGNSGEMFAPGSPENLRIVRGVVNSDGSAPSGCCFSVAHATTGQYDITFAQSYLSPPSVVASSTTTGGLVNVVFLSNSSVRIVIRNSTNTAAINGGFHFIAMGER
jgi:hypothetical protein